jgi:hypothetical protein
VGGDKGRAGGWSDSATTPSWESEVRWVSLGIASAHDGANNILLPHRAESALVGRKTCHVFGCGLLVLGPIWMPVPVTRCSHRAAALRVDPSTPLCHLRGTSPLPFPVWDSDGIFNPPSAGGGQWGMTWVGGEQGSGRSRTMKKLLVSIPPRLRLRPSPFTWSAPQS